MQGSRNWRFPAIEPNSKGIRFTQDVKEHFQGRLAKILTCAYFLVSEGDALCHVERWSARNFSQYDNILTSQRISELLVRVTLSLQMDFFKAWTEHHKKDEYYALDITSISSYAEAIAHIRSGYNKHTTLPKYYLLDKKL